MNETDILVSALETGSAVVGSRRVHSATDDFEELRADINDVYYPARLELVDPASSLSDARMTAVKLPRLTVGVVRFGADVLIDPGDVGGYHVDLPVTGTVATSCAGERVLASPSRAAVYTPSRHTLLSSWNADATQVSIKIDRNALEDELALILGRPVTSRVDFDVAFDMDSPAGSRWYATLRMLLDTVVAPGPVAGRGLEAQIDSLERALIIELLVGHSSSVLHEVNATDDKAVPSSVLGRVVEMVEAAPGAQYAVTDLAAAAGIGVRQLQHMFREQYGMSPSAYVRNVRLDGARRDLSNGTRPESVTPESVTDVAFRWGFNHLGRFAQYYERKFGETPSATLRRGRG